MNRKNPTRRSRIYILALAALSTLLTPPNPGVAQEIREPSLEPCTLRVNSGHPISETAFCGRFPVPEDRSDPTGRWITLNVVVARSTSPNREPDPIVRFVGGPGQGAAQMAGGLVGRARSTWPNRDIVFVDQRGTGESNGLFCEHDIVNSRSADEVLWRVIDPEEYLPCARELSARADLTQYHTSIAADDLVDVLDWLEYGRVNLVGGSYGTRMAQVFMRRHPDRVRTAVMDGLITMNAMAPVTYSPDATRSLDRLIESCLRQAECGSIYPDLRSEVDEVFERLGQAPAEFTVRDPRTGANARVRLRKAALGYAVRGMLYSGFQFPDLPRELHLAFQGDYTPLALRFLNRKIGLSTRAFAHGLYFAILCTEDLPFVTRQHVAANGGTLMDDVLINEYSETCAGWPRGELPEGFHDPVAVDTPTLLISSEFDPATPIWMGEAVQEHLPNALHLRLPGGGHGASSNPNAPPCVTPIKRAFVQAGGAEGLDTSCVASIRQPEFRIPARDRPRREGS